MPVEQRCRTGGAIEPSPTTLDFVPVTVSTEVGGPAGSPADTGSAQDMPSPSVPAPSLIEIMLAGCQHPSVAGCRHRDTVAGFGSGATRRALIAARAGLRVWVATQPVDFRRGVNGLAALVGSDIGSRSL